MHKLQGRVARRQCIGDSGNAYSEGKPQRTAAQNTRKGDSDSVTGVDSTARVVHVRIATAGNSAERGITPLQLVPFRDETRHRR